MDTQKEEFKRMKTKYKKPDWAVDQIIRGSGLVEDICEHGVGHPNKEWLAEHDLDNRKSFAVHGCDGCCSRDTNYQRDEKEMGDNVDIHQLLSAFLEIIEPIEDIAKATSNKIWEIITELKQTDGEHWAVGEMLERAFIFRAALEIDSKK